MNLTTLQNKGQKIIHDNASNETFKHIKNVLRILFISRHDFYVLISILGLANCLFVYENKLGSVAGPVIQANGRLTFEDDLRTGGLLYFTTQ